MSVDLRDINSQIEELEFSPTEEQIKVKAKLMGILQGNPLYSMDELTIDLAVELTKNRKLYKWSKESPEFLSWLRNKNEFRQRLEYLISKSLDTAERILDDPESSAAAQVNLIKVLCELGNRFPNKVKEVKYLDAEIGKMSPEQVQAYIEKHVEKVIPIAPLAIDTIEGELESEKEETGEAEGSETDDTR